MTDIRLALGGDEKSLVQALVHEWDTPPSVLVSYVYLKIYHNIRDKIRIRDWVLDSGAFSAFNSGKEIDVYEFIDKCHELKESERLLSEVFALDVIGDWEASLKNCEIMWNNDVQAIPCFHYGEPDHALEEMSNRYPKIALGGTAHLRGKKKDEWQRQCFARVWPKKIHGFGVGGEKEILALPWHSVDATSWVLQPMGYGLWKEYRRLPVRKVTDIRNQVKWYLKLERRAKQIWRKEMELLEET